MQFTATREAMLSELILTSGIAEKKTSIPILLNVHVRAVGDRVDLTATDLELGMRCSFPAAVKKDGESTIPAKRLMDYVRLLPEGDISSDTSETHWTTFKSGKSRT